MEHLNKPNKEAGGIISKASLLLVRNTIFVVALLFGFAFLVLFKAIPTTPDGQSLVYTTADYEGRKTQEQRKAPLFKDAFENKKKDGVSGGWGVSIGDNY